MQPQVAPLQEGKDSTARAPSRAFQLNLLKFFALFLILGLGASVLSMYMMRQFGALNLVPTPSSVYLPCVEESTNLDRWIKPPSSLMHSMNDEELFWRASFVPRINKYPFRRVPKVAFMFLTRGPLPLSPLWERFLKGHEALYSIYIHSLPSYHPDFSSTSVFYRRQIPSKVTEWGQMSMCDAERRLLANALLDISNEWFVLLSESCIPLFNFSIIYTYFLRSRHSFVGAFDDPSPHGRGRYNPRMAPEVNITEWRKGAQWFTVNQKIAVSMVRDTKFYPKFKEFCRPGCYVDEHYFPTMLTIEEPRLIANRSVTWVDWSRGGAHPATFGKPDITEAFLNRLLEGHSCLYNNQPSSVCFLFARKFAPSALEPLLEFAPKFFGYG
ncbi:glycosyltransferase BC10-like [Magnolia sinica]|uniref:glycosyltransferase BC10-like n=1 Tax=Magnolia sinica TaxID=86752 RepID=UPI00265AE3AE|nr:glycosyltransferase BC10-like [Magnolia sinica]XP_058068460.1 glycosyltransferase BC10-like [Magnolia sinica]XP_058068467.1 glycosyltransferase BC10-like [Magnolia sinica]